MFPLAYETKYASHGSSVMAKIFHWYTEASVSDFENIVDSRLHIAAENQKA